MHWLHFERVERIEYFGGRIVLFSQPNFIILTIISTISTAQSLLPLNRGQHCAIWRPLESEVFQRGYGGRYHDTWRSRDTRGPALWHVTCDAVPGCLARRACWWPWCWRWWWRCGGRCAGWPPGSTPLVRSPWPPHTWDTVRLRWWLSSPRPRTEAQVTAERTPGSWIGESPITQT